MLENGVLKVMRDLAVGDQVLVSMYSLDKNLKLISSQEGKAVSAISVELKCETR